MSVRIEGEISAGRVDFQCHSQAGQVSLDKIIKGWTQIQKLNAVSQTIV